MKLQQLILKIVLSIELFFVSLFKIKNNRITFISLEGDHLSADQKIIYEALDKNQYDVRLCLIDYHKDLWGQFLYFLNCMKQLYLVNTSKIVFIRDNNYVVSNFKRAGVNCIQLWHAAGAVKKFGNAISRKYAIANYDYVIATSTYWQEPYHEAFSIKKENVLPMGMARCDELFNEQWILDSRNYLFNKYPQLAGKKIILYAPTFRGNIYVGFSAIDFDACKILDQLGDDYVLLYKFHPLLKTRLASRNGVYNMNEEDTHQLFTICDYMISDYSSIVFDYMILHKPMLFFAPDLEAYGKDVGYFVDINALGYPVCKTEMELVDCISNYTVSKERMQENLDTFFSYQDDKATSRIIDFIEKLSKN